MEQQILFKELKMYYLSKLDKLITVIDKVHRNLNPEIHDVKRIWITINTKLKTSKDNK